MCPVAPVPLHRLEKGGSEMVALAVFSNDRHAYPCDVRLYADRVVTGVYRACKLLTYNRLGMISHNQKMCI